jgi:hypothetical protein
MISVEQPPAKSCPMKLRTRHSATEALEQSTVAVKADPRAIQRSFNGQTPAGDR